MYSALLHLMKATLPVLSIRASAITSEFPSDTAAYLAQKPKASSLANANGSCTKRSNALIVAVKAFN